MSNKKYNLSNQLLKRSLKSIPLASQTFSKSITQYPEGCSPLFIKKAKASHIVDIDDNKYLDFVNCLASVSLGYCYKEVDAAIIQQLSNGISFSLPHLLETEVAEELIKIIPCAEKVRFGKNGTDATSAAIRLARAYTKKDHIAVCGYHGWQDWYIASTTKNEGIPEETKKLTHKFQYNNIKSLEAILKMYDNNVAAVILEPMNIEFPKDNFLQKVKELTHKYNAVLIFDEVVTGFRYSLGGAQEYFKVTPDLASFGKSIANGCPLSAIVGKNEIMKKMEDIFFSGTFAGETLSLAAAKATINVYKNKKVIDHFYNLGTYLNTELNKIIKRNKAEDVFHLSGHPAWIFLHVQDQEQFSSYEIKTLFLQEMFQKGILILFTHNLSYSHTKQDIDTLLDAYSEVIPLIIQAIKTNSLKEKIKGKILQPLFKVR